VPERAVKFWTKTNGNNDGIHMKRYLLSTVVAALGLMEFGIGHLQAAAVTTNGLLSTIAIVGVFSPTNSPVMTTNTIGNVITSTYTSKPVKIANKDILTLLEAEYGTTFPAGAQLAYNLTGNPSGFVVLDKNGNLVLNVSTNLADSSYRFSLTNGSEAAVISGKAVKTTTTSSTNTVESVTETVGDYAIYYADGKGNNFHFTGVIELKADALVTSSNTVYKTLSIVLSGAGGGKFFNTADTEYDQGAFTKATWSASGKNVTQ
jgi:hypothetical protein